MKKFIILNDRKIKNLIKLIFCITIFYFFILFVIEKIKISTFFYLSYLFFVNYFLFYLYLLSKKEKNYFPIYPLIIFYYLLSYSCYFYFTPHKLYYGETLELLPYLILIISLGIISFSVGYFAPNYLNSKKKIYEFKIDNRYEYLLIFFFIIILIFYYINYPNKFVTSNILQQLKEPLILFLLAYFQIKYLDTKKNSILILNIFLLLFFFIIELSFGSFAFSFLLIVLVISINYYKLKKINIMTISLVFISIYMIHSIKDDLRKVTWKHFQVSETTTKEINVNMQNIQKFLVSSNSQLELYILKLNRLKDEKSRMTNENNRQRHSKEIEIINQKIFNLKAEIFQIEKNLNKELSLFNLINKSKNYYDVVTNTYKKKAAVDKNLEIYYRNKIAKNVTDTFDVINTNLFSKKVISEMMEEGTLFSQKYRFFHSNISLQAVIMQTPKKIYPTYMPTFRDVDFFNGTSYRHLYKKFIPRFINKNKPREEWGNYWGKRYGLVHDGDYATSWNFPILNEFFANYGLKGVVIGMFLLGMFIKTLMITLLINSSNAVVCSGVCVITINFFFQEHNLSMILGKIISYSTFFGLIFISILITSYFFERIIHLKK